ncbi:hypothetical protein ACFLXB_08715 [Chloroflexota bacterium]
MHSNNQQQIYLNMLSKGGTTVEKTQELLTIFMKSQTHGKDNKIQFSFDTCE